MFQAPRPLAELAGAAWRLRQTPLFTLCAILVLGIGLGVGVGAFIFINAIYFKPFDAGRQFVRITASSPYRDDGGLQPADVQRLLTNPPRSFALLAGYSLPSVPASQMAVVIDGRSVRVAVEGVAGSYFDAFGVTPLAGRLLVPADDDGTMAAVISERLWRRVFNADPSAIGRTLIVAGQTVTLVGVAAGPFGGSAQGGRDVWVPAHVLPVSRLFARLAPWATIEQANAELRVIFEQEGGSPDARIRVEEGLTSGPASLGLRGFAVIGNILAMGLLVAAIAASSVALMLYARVSSRQADLAIRLALGASTRDLTRAMTFEIAMLVAAGAGLAILTGIWLSHLVVGDLVRTSGMALTFDPTPDWRIVIYAASAACALGVLLRMRISWMIRASTAITPLTSTGGLGGSTLRMTGWPRWLIVGQTAATTALLLAALLIARGVISGARFSAGLDVEHVAIAWLDQSGHQRAAAWSTHQARLVLDAARTLPGIRHAAIISRVPGTLSGSRASATPFGLSEGYTAHTQQVTSEAFRVLGLPILSGRTFTEREDAHGGNVAVVSASTAASFWSSQDPIGQRLTLTSRGEQSQPFVVVGTVADVRPRDQDQRQPRDVYLPFGHPDVRRERLAVIVWSEHPAAVTAPRLRAHIQRTLPETALVSVEPLREEFARAMGLAAFMARVAGLLGVLALMVALAGLYGLTAHLAALRRREMAIRKALGASTGAVCRGIARETWRTQAAGVLAGVLIGLLGRSLLKFPSMAAGDIPVVLTVAGLVFLTGMAGAVLPFLPLLRGAATPLREN